MNIKKIAGDSAVALLSQGIGMLLSIFTSLLVPKLLGVESYGYWQLFIFYSSYVGLFHFGLCDGVYLREGGCPRDKLDKRKVNSIFWCGIVYQLAFVVIATTFLLSNKNSSDRVIVLLSTAVVLIISNAYSFFGYLFQAINETRIFSYSVIIDRVSYIIPVLGLIIAKNANFAYYILSYIFARSIALLFCIVKGWDILTSGFISIRQTFRETFDCIRVGCKLLFATLASMLILGVARFAIDSRWGIETFGKVSFALSLVTFIMQFLMQVSMVLFPALRQANSSERKKAYISISGILDTISPFVYVMYFPVMFVISSWLPQYKESMLYFALLLPICVFDGKMDMCCTTFFKVLRQEKKLLCINVMTLIISSVLTFISAWVFGSLYCVLIGMVSAVFLRNLFSEYMLNKDFEVKFSLTYFVCVLMSGLFILFAYLFETIIAFSLYIGALVVYAYSQRTSLCKLSTGVKRIMVGDKD